MTSRPAFTPRLMSAPTAARYLGIGETYLRELVKAGEIARPKRQGKRVLFDVRDLDDFADGLPRDEPVEHDDWGDAAA